ncbi:MAG TPA: hypothetical protein VKU00_28710 [Chthonomonadaceae bacterium]|nr:hypothetical protein [Chthonomonadaceae bacterium]
MATYTQMSGDEVAQRGKALYADGIRAKVEIPENIGKMVIIDVETGDYEVDELGLEASHHLHAKRPDAPLYGIRIGYNVAESLGGVMERTEA